MANLVQCFFMHLFGKKKELKPEKIRIKVKNSRIVMVYYPARIVDNHTKYAMARQQVACYEVKLNGNPLLKGLGA